jgi:hypothetical protein
LTESNRGDELTEFGRLKLKNLSFGGCSVGGCKRVVGGVVIIVGNFLVSWLYTCLIGEFLNECGSTIICFSFWKFSMIEILM